MATIPTKESITLTPEEFEEAKPQEPNAWKREVNNPIHKPHFHEPVFDPQSKTLEPEFLEEQWKKAVASMTGKNGEYIPSDKENLRRMLESYGLWGKASVHKTYDKLPRVYKEMARMAFYKDW